MDQIEAQARGIGAWMGSQGYLGAFGLDFMLQGDKLLFTEINSRFQGSTRLSCRMSALAGLPCIMLDHVAAMLGMEPTLRMPLRSLIEETGDQSQIVLHNTRSEALLLTPNLIANIADDCLQNVNVEILPSDHAAVAPNAIVAVLRQRSAITTDGYSLSEPWSSQLQHLHEKMNGLVSTQASRHMKEERNI